MNGSKWSKHILKTHILSTRTRHMELLHQKLGLSEVLPGATAALADQDNICVSMCGAINQQSYRAVWQIMMN